MKISRKYLYLKSILCLGLLFEMVLANSVAIDKSGGLPQSLQGGGVELAMGTHERMHQQMNRVGNQSSWGRYDDNCEDCETNDGEEGYQMNYDMGSGTMGGMDYRMMSGMGYGNMGEHLRFFGDEVRNYMVEIRNDLGAGFIPVVIGIAVIAVVLALSGALALLSVALIIPILVIFTLIRIIQATAWGEKNRVALAQGKEGAAEENSEATHVGKYVYLLYLIGMVLPFLWIAGVVISYVYGSGGSKWMESHFRYQIRTFWIGVLFWVISCILAMVVIGLLGYVFLLFWAILRSVKGLRLYNQSQPIPNPTTWLW